MANNAKLFAQFQQNVIKHSQDDIAKVVHECIDANVSTAFSVDDFMNVVCVHNEVRIGGHWLCLGDQEINLCETPLGEIYVSKNMGGQQQFFSGASKTQKLPPNVLIFQGEFDPCVSMLFIQSITAAAEFIEKSKSACTDPHLLYILIHSPGGDVSQLERVLSALSSKFAMNADETKYMSAYEALRKCNAKNGTNGQAEDAHDTQQQIDRVQRAMNWTPDVKIVTYVPFEASSCAFALFSKGCIRLVRPQAKLLCHVPKANSPYNSCGLNEFDGADLTRDLKTTRQIIFALCEHTVLNNFKKDNNTTEDQRKLWFDKVNELTKIDNSNVFDMLHSRIPNGKRQNYKFNEQTYKAREWADKNIYDLIIGVVGQDVDSYFINGVTASMLCLCTVSNGLDIVNIQVPRFKLNFSELDAAEWHADIETQTHAQA